MSGAIARDADALLNGREVDQLPVSAVFRRDDRPFVAYGRSADASGRMQIVVLPARRRRRPALP
jgi:hypothetical protein